MKIIYNKWIPFPGYKCINLFGVIFARKGANIDEETLNHEAIHTAQMKELAYVFFYLLYFIEFLIYLIRDLKFHESYRKVSFEKEAHENDKNPDYLTSRKHYAWFKYW